MQKLSKQEILAIHEAIHDPKVQFVEVGGQKLAIYLGIYGQTVMEQNKSKKSANAARALEGAKITWFMTRPTWGCVDDGIITKSCWLFDDENKVENVNRTPPTKKMKIKEDPIPASTGATDVLAQLSVAEKKVAVKSAPSEPSRTHILNVKMEGVATAAVADVGNTRRSSRISAQPAKEYDDVEDDIEDFDDDKPQSKRSGLQRETKKRKTMDRDPESHEYDDFDDSENNDIGEEDGDIQDNLEVDDADMDQTDSDLSDPNKFLQPWCIDFEELTLGDKLGVGGFGEVRRGEWRGTDVAVKILHSQDEAATKMFFKEAALLCKLRHVNIVPSFGACVKPPNLAIIMEMMSKNLTGLIREHAGPLPEPLILKVALGIAKGLQFLHQSKPRIIHRDLKPDNILLDAAGIPKIADFGVSREKLQTEQMTRIGTPSYCAPEIMKNLAYSERVDIYSFGMLLHTMVTGTAPFKGAGKNGSNPNQLQIMLMVSAKKMRPKIPQECPAYLRELIENCWQHDPRARPTAEEVVKTLTARIR